MKTLYTPLIYLIEDDQSYRIMLKYILRKNKFRNVRSFLNINDCLEERGEQPDIIVLDEKTLGGNSILVEKLRKRFRNARIICLSSGREVKRAVAFMKSGASDYILKDYQILKNLIATVKQIAIQKSKKQVALADKLIIGWAASMAAVFILYTLL